MRRLALIAAAAVALAGCGGSRASSSGPTPHSHYPLVGYVPVVVAANRLSPDLLRGQLARLVSPTRLAIVTTGSSSCPSVPDALVVESPHRIGIHLTVGSWERGALVAHPPPGGACTADYGTTRMVVAIDPKRIAVYRRLTVRFFYNDSKRPGVWTAAPLKR